MRLENIYVPIQFQGHGAKVKVTATKTGCTGRCSVLGRNFILDSNCRREGPGHEDEF